MLFKILSALFQKVKNDENAPIEWKISHMSSIFNKKGNRKRETTIGV